MPTLPPTILAAFLPFASIFFSSATRSKAFLLAFGAILCRGGRTVCSALRTLGMSGERVFSKYHHVLNRASWDCLKASKILLEQIIGEDKEVVVAIDGHLERRSGRKIRAKGCYRDPVKSSRNHVVKSFGLKWLSMTVLKKFEWNSRAFALPFFTVLVPHHKSEMQENRPHKTLLEWAEKMVAQLRRWLPDHRIILVGDGEFATASLAWVCLKQKVALISRLRLDARLFDFPEPHIGPGRPAKKGKRLKTPKQALQMEELDWQEADVEWYGGKTRRVLLLTNTALWHVSGYDPVPIRFVIVKDPLGSFEPVTLMSTNVILTASRIVELFVERWGIEVTFREAREYLGVETQRQWSDKAVARTTPVLFGLYSLIVLIGNRLYHAGKAKPQQATWYAKQHLTFSDLLTAVRAISIEEMNYEGVGIERQTAENSDRTMTDRLLQIFLSAA